MLAARQGPSRPLGAALGRGRVGGGARPALGSKLLALLGLFAAFSCRTDRPPPVPPSEWLFAAGDEPPYAQGRAAADLPHGFPLEWQPGQVLLQGTLGASFLSDLTLDGDAAQVELDDDSYEVLPAVGGGAQLKLAGRGFDLGLEGLLAFSGRSSLEAFASSGGTAVAAFDLTLLVFELYGGPFVSRFVGDRVRIYAAGGPLLQWVAYDPDDDDSSNPESDDADGSGGGLYARGGLEFLLPSGKLVGLGARWTDSSVDLGGSHGDLDLRGLEVSFSYAYGLMPRSRFDW